MKAILKFCGITFGLAIPLTVIYAVSNRPVPTLGFTIPSNFSSPNPMAWTVSGSVADWMSIIGVFFFFASAGFLAWLFVEIIELYPPPPEKPDA